MKKYIKELDLLKIYLFYTIDLYPKKPITFEVFKKKQQNIKNVEIEKAKKQALKKHCFYCHCSLNGEETVDHIVPISRGGKNNQDNKVYACERCNNLKADHTLSDFLIFLKKQLKKTTRRGEKYGLNDKILIVMISSVKILIKTKSIIIHKISEYESMI